MAYSPKPEDYSALNIPSEVIDVLDALAEAVHDRWASKRIDEGWILGPVLDSQSKQHPCLVPYSDLPEAEKDRDRASVLQTVGALIACGFEIRQQS